MMKDKAGMRPITAKKGTEVDTGTVWQNGEKVYYQEFWTDAISCPQDQYFMHGIANLRQVCRIEGSLYSPAGLHAGLCTVLGNINPYDQKAFHSIIADKEAVFLDVGTDFQFDYGYHTYVRLYYTKQG
jgi:hypothetical protein